MPGEMAQDESLSDSGKTCEVNIHHQILHRAVEAMHKRFLTHGTVYADVSLLHPKSSPLSTPVLCLNLYLKDSASAELCMTAGQEGNCYQSTN